MECSGVDQGVADISVVTREDERSRSSLGNASRSRNISRHRVGVRGRWDKAKQGIIGEVARTDGGSGDDSISELKRAIGNRRQATESRVIAR